MYKEINQGFTLASGQQNTTGNITQLDYKSGANMPEQQETDNQTTMTRLQVTDPRVLQAFSDIDDADDLFDEAASKTRSAKEELISLGWREVKYVVCGEILIFMVSPLLIEGLQTYHLHIDNCMRLFFDQEHNAAQRYVNDNTNLWIQVPVIL